MIDIDECGTDNGYCDHLCTNTNGSYICSCHTGYQLESDKHNCTGISLQKCVQLHFKYL